MTPEQVNRLASKMLYEELSLDAVQHGDLKAYAWLVENCAERLNNNEPLDPRDQDDDN